MLPRRAEAEHLARRVDADEGAHAAGRGLQVVLEAATLSGAYGGAEREQTGRRVERVPVLVAVAQAGVAPGRVEVGNDRAVRPQPGEPGDGDADAGDPLAEAKAIRAISGRR